MAVMQIDDLDTDARAAIADALIPKDRGVDRFLYVWKGRDDKLLNYLPEPIFARAVPRSRHAEKPLASDQDGGAQLLPFERPKL
jgi:hypothetical protein